MALTPQDKEFYEEKLSMKNLYWLVGATMLIGAIGWPVLFYLNDLSTGLAKLWTLNVAFDWSMFGLMVGSMVGILMYLAFKFLLAMGWLPSRR